MKDAGIVGMIKQEAFHPVLPEFAKQGLLGSFPPVYATLRKLPRVRTYAFAPKNLVSLVEQDDADVRPEAVSVEHNQTPNF